MTNIFTFIKFLSSHLLLGIDENHGP